MSASVDRQFDAARPGAVRPSAPLLLLHVPLEALRLLLWFSVFAVSVLALGRGSDADKVAARSARVRTLLIRLGPLYMKAGQVLATQSGLLPKAATDELRDFFNDLPAMSLRQLHRVLRRSFGGRHTQIFTVWDDTPVAVGSVAQVHLAQFSDGQRVAVKVVKHGVRERLFASAWLIDKFLAPTALVPQLRSLEARQQFAEVRPLLVQQCSMRIEAANQRECAENFADHPYVRVPTVIAEHSSDDVLVMEFMDGVPGHSPQEGLDRVLLGQRLMDTFYSAVFFHGFFHVDPHPGNMLFAENGSLQLLDFGLFGKLSEVEKWQIAGFYYACIRQEWPTAIERMTKAFVASPGSIYEQWDDYQAAMTEVLRKHFELKTDQWSTVAFFDDSAAVLRRYRARITTSFTLVALGLLTGEGFVSQTDPDIDIWSNARRFTDRFSPYMSPEIQARFTESLAPKISTSMQLKQEAKAYIVAPTHLDRYVLPSAFPLIIEKAQGSRIWDVDGNEYIDLSCGYGPNILGYAPPSVTEAISQAAAAGSINALGNRQELRLAEEISAAFGPDATTVLSNSGTEAVIMALRIARAATGKDRVAKFEGHYHGFSDQGMVSGWFRADGPKEAPTAIQGSAGSQSSVVDATLVLQGSESHSLDRLRAASHELAAVIIEPMPGASASMDVDFLRELRQVCDETGVVLIFDEIVTGFRVAYGGAQTLAGIRPDLTCLGKIIGGGLPCGAVVGKSDLVEFVRTTGDPFEDVERRGFVGGTMSGNSITAAAGLATLHELRHNPKIYDHLAVRGRQLREGLMEAAASRGVPCRVGGEHSLFSITFDYATPKHIRDKVAGTNVKAMLALSYYMRQFGVYVPELHTLMLNYAHSMEDIQEVVAAFARSLDEMLKDGMFTV